MRYTLRVPWFALLLAAGLCAARSDCALDAASKTCAPVAAGQRGEAGSVATPRDTCVCEAGECKPFTVAPVSCRTFRDCSFAREPFLRPVSSKVTPREHKRPVRPCKDAQKDAVCDPKTRTCRLVAWSC
jgi:hypothetical protein